MEKVISFICENWKLIAYCVLAIVCLVSALVRKKPVKVIDSVEDALLKLIPALVVHAETFIGPGKGQEKLDEVIKCCNLFIEEHFPGIDFDSYIEFIKAQVEYILSTPQKKKGE